jgi:cyclase
MITRRQFLGISTIAAGSALLPAPLKALMMQSDRFRPLRGDVGIYVNRGGTIAWLNNSDALAVVDTQYPGTAMDCLNGLHRQNERMIDAVLNTHHHGDHTGGNGVFRPYTREILPMPTCRDCSGPRRSGREASTGRYIPIMCTGRRIRWMRAAKPST